MQCWIQMPSTHSCASVESPHCTTVASTAYYYDYESFGGKASANCIYRLHWMPMKAYAIPSRRLQCIARHYQEPASWGEMPGTATRRGITSKLYPIVRNYRHTLRGPTIANKARVLSSGAGPTKAKGREQEKFSLSVSTYCLV